MGSTSSVDDDFDAATSCVGSLAASGELTDDDLLRFYGLFKQATEGTCDIPKPPFFDLKGRAKWAAWQAIGDISSDAARAAYIDLLTSLKPEWDAKPAKTSGGAGGGVFSSLAHDDADDNEEVRSFYCCFLITITATSSLPNSNSVYCFREGPLR